MLLQDSIIVKVKNSKLTFLIRSHKDEKAVASIGHHNSTENNPLRSALALNKDTPIKLVGFFFYQVDESIYGNYNSQVHLYSDQ